MKKYIISIQLILISLLTIGQKSELIQPYTDSLTNINVESTNFVNYAGTLIDGDKPISIALQLKYFHKDQHFDYVLGIKSICHDYVDLRYFFHCFDDSSKVILKFENKKITLYNVNINNWSREIYFYGIINKHDINTFKTIPIESIAIYYNNNSFVKYNSARNKKYSSEILIREFELMPDHK